MNLQDQLTSAVLNEWTDEIAELLRAGADVNGLDSHGDTPLIAALDNRTANEVVTFLVRSGADVNTGTNRVGSPLHMAVASALDLYSQGHDNKLTVDHIEILLDNGANPDRCDSSGKSPIDRAREYGEIGDPIVAMLGPE